MGFTNDLELCETNMGIFDWLFKSAKAPPIECKAVPVGWREYTINLKGVSHYQKAIRNVHDNEDALLVPEPTNRYDKNAIKVCRVNGDLLGYIPAHLAERAQPDAPSHFRLLDSGVLTTVSVHGHDTLGITLRVLIPPKVKDEPTHRKVNKHDV